MSTCDRAKQHRVNEFVRNLSNGNVEIVAAGKDEPVDALIDWAKSGPSSTMVNNLQIEVMNYNDGEFNSFTIRQ